MSGIDELYALYLRSKGVSTDTRTIKPGELFFALSGENFDGNKFAVQALESGAAGAVVSDRQLTGPDFHFVPDVLEALQQTALLRRKSMEIPVIGITGSNGKTTTKELLNCVLSQKYDVTATVGNLNNHIGVPLTILRIPESCELAIVEMGANHVGEIRDLCKMSLPTHGVITNVGSAHIEGFGGIEGVKRGKGELYESLTITGGTAFVNAGERFLEDMAARVEKQVLYEISESGECDDRIDYCFSLVAHACQTELDMKTPEGTSSFVSHLFGEHNAQNVATAVAFGLEFGVTPSQIRSALLEYVPDNNRSQVLKTGSRTIILDAYNANPTSMYAAIKSFMSREGKKALILGGMNELGETSNEEHRELVAHLNSLDLEFVVLVGEHYSGLAGGYQWFETTAQLKAYLDDHDLPSADILIKGSRSIELESVVSSIH